MADIPACMRNIVICVALFGLAGLAFAQAQQVYRYVAPDGRVVYTDKPPPADAKATQTKRLGGNFVETSEAGYAAQQAQQRFPVTLYSFDCGELCDSAQALLNKRGVPHTVVNVTQAENAEKLKRLTGGQEAPVLQVGDKLVVKGFNESKWQATLDEAGYPKTPAPRTTPLSKPSTPTPPIADKKAATQAVPMPAQSASSSAPEVGKNDKGGYPIN